MQQKTKICSFTVWEKKKKIEVLPNRMYVQDRERVKWLFIKLK